MRLQGSFAKGDAIFCSVARVGLPTPFSNSERMRGEMCATFLAYSFWAKPRMMIISVPFCQWRFSLGENG